MLELRTLDPKPRNPKPRSDLLLCLYENKRMKHRVLVKGFTLGCHNKETISFTIDPYHGNLNYVP